MQREIKTVDEIREIVQARVNGLLLVKERIGGVTVGRPHRIKPVHAGCNWNIQAYLYSDALNEAIYHVVEALRRQYQLPELWTARHAVTQQTLPSPSASF
jgi:hypothetical protein